MLTRVLLAMLFMSGCLLGAAGRDELSAQPYVRTLTRGEGSGAAGVFRLDRELYRRVDDCRRGLLLFAPDGREIPLAVRRAAVEALPSETPLLPAKLSARRYDSTDPTAGVLFDNAGGKPVTAIRIRTAERDFEKLVRVEAGPDGKNWRTVLEAEPFFDYSGTVEAGRREFRFPAAVSDRVIRVRIMDYPGGAASPGRRINGGILGDAEFAVRRRLRIDRIEACLDGEKLPVAEELSERVRPSSPEKADGDTTVLTFECGPYPVNGFELETSSGDFARKATVYGSSDGGKYIRLADGELYSIDGGRFRRLRLDLPESRFPFYRIVIRNEGLAPLENCSVTALSPVYEAVFGDASPLLTLAYGGDSHGVSIAKPPAEAPVRYALGPERPNPDWHPEKVNWMRRGLVLVVGAMLVVLCVLLWRGYKSIEK